MDKVQRYGLIYNCDTGMSSLQHRPTTGEYVLHSDYLALQAERDRLAAESEGRRVALLAKAEEARSEWLRAERLAAEVAEVRAERDASDDVALKFAATNATLERIAHEQRQRATAAESALGRVRGCQRYFYGNDDNWHPDDKGEAFLASDVLGAIGREG